MKSQRQHLISIIESFPLDKEFTSTSLSRDTGLDINYVSAVLGEMRDKYKKIFKIRGEPGETGKRLRYVYTRRNPLDKKEVEMSKIPFKMSILKQYTTRELLEEITSRVA